MSALGFLGGLGATASSMMQGYERAEDREAVRKDREYQAKQREFEQGQQKRKIDEQARADKQRVADASIKTTEEVDDPSWTPTPTSDNPVAQVVIGEDGSETVTAPTPQQAPKVTRKRNWDAIYGDYAKNRRDAGDVAGAIKFEEQADTASHKQAAQAFQQWSTTTPDTASLHDAAKSAAKMYNSDRMPGKVTNISEPATDGSVTVTLKNGSTGESFDRTFKTVAELKAGMESYYSPETRAAYIKSLREAQIKAQEKNAEPRVVNPGGALIAGGKEIYKNTTDRVQIGEDENGNPIYGKPAGGTKSAGTSGKAPKSAPEEASDYLKDALGGKGDGSAESAARYTRAHSYLDGIYATNPSVPPRTASAIAADAAADPTRVTLQLNNKTGVVSKVYSNPDFEGGKQFELGPNSGSVAEMEKVKGKAGMVQSVNGMVADLAANVAPEQRDNFRTQLLKAATDPVARKAALDAAKANGQDLQAMTRQLDLIKSYGAPAPAPEKTLKKDVGGMAPNKFNGLSGKALQDAVTADLREKVAANRPNAERMTKARADAAADPDLKRLDAERASALRAGRAVDANAKIAEANKLRNERYGF